LSRNVESREVEKDSKSGVTALKERLQEREEKQSGGNGNGETEPELETVEVENEGQDGPDPVEPELRDPETNKKVAEEKKKLQTAGAPKSNLF